ncbi:MAG: hypothetical protein WC521_03945 [Bdellovibrionales bacterium]
MKNLPERKWQPKKRIEHIPALPIMPEVEWNQVSITLTNQSDEDGVYEALEKLNISFKEYWRPIFTPFYNKKVAIFSKEQELSTSPSEQSEQPLPPKICPIPPKTLFAWAEEFAPKYGIVWMPSPSRPAVSARGLQTTGSTATLEGCEIY